MRPTAAGGSPLILVLLAVLLASTASGLAAGVTVDTGHTRTQTADSYTTIWTVSIDRDGDARWTIEWHFHLDTEDRRAGFQRLANEFENGSNEHLTVEPFERANRLAAEATDREMAIDAVRRTTRVQNDTGILELSFTWRSFAVVDGDRLELGDVFQTPEGTWLPGLTEDQVLIIEFPRGFTPENLVWELRNGAVYIDGPVTFSPGQPAATFVLTGNTPTATPTVTPTASPTPTIPGPSPTPAQGDEVVVPLVGLLLLLVVGALAVLVWQHNGELPGWAGGTEPGDGPHPGGDPTPSNPTASASPAAPEPESSSVDQTTESEAQSEPLLSDEERVLQLLADNDGRMKQAKIVQETDWSNAKVSQLLTDMAEKGEVEKLRIGRENLISLPGRSPDGVE